MAASTSVIERVQSAVTSKDENLLRQILRELTGNCNRVLFSLIKSISQRLERPYTGILARKSIFRNMSN